jgi:chromosomal replication initiator protein
MTKKQILQIMELQQQIKELRKTIEDSKEEVIKQAIAEVMQNYSISMENLMGFCRKREYVLPRHVLMYKLYSIGIKLTDIGSLMGNRDHTTIIHGIKKIRSQKDFYDDIII